MSVYNLIIWDDRIKGQRPRRGDRTFQVNDGTHLSWVLRNVAERAQAHRGQTFNLHIISHGIERKSADGTEMIGGWGIYVCKEGLNVYTINRLSRWKGLINNIVIYACSAARTDSRALSNGEGDGSFLCRNIARITGANVIASTVPQAYTAIDPDGKGISPGDWEGPVFGFTPNGEITQII